MTIPKTEKGIWKSLFYKNQKPNGMQLRVWWELRGQYPEAMSRYERMVEDDDEEDDDVSFFLV